MALYQNFDQEFNDRYLISGVLGKGGMGLILQAFDKILAIDVAIKILQHDNSAIASMRLQREAIAAGRLNHVNIAKIFDFGLTASGDPYIVMEFVSGKTLADLIQDSAAISYERAIKIFLQICRGLEYAHSNKVIHRDLKPSNIMLIQNEQESDLVKILDFGVAKIQTDQNLTSTGAIVGSPLYLSPEQADGLDIDQRSDIYSLGCLMFEILAGQPPLKGNSAIETIRLHKKVAPPLLSELSSKEFPSELVKLVDECLSKNPNDRPQSARQLMDRLDRILHPNIEESEFSQNEKALVFNENQLEKLTSKFSKSTALLVGFALTLPTLMVLLYLYSNYLSKEKSLNKGNPIVKLKLSDTVVTNKALVDFQNPHFERTTINGLATLITKKETTDTDFLDEKRSNPSFLKIDEGQITGIALAHFPKHSLTTIAIRNAAFDLKNLRYLSEFKNLKKIELKHKGINDSTLEEIVKLKNIEDLSLCDTAITDKGLSMLEQMPKLRNLALFNCPLLSREIGSIIFKIKNLNYLRLPCNQSSKSWSAISKSNIKALDLTNLELDRESLKQICSNEKLSELCISNVKLQGQDFSILANQKPWKTVSLKSQEIFSPQLLKCLLKINTKNLDLSDSKISKKSLYYLLENPNLSRINCDDCKSLNYDESKLMEKQFAKRWNKQLEVQTQSISESELRDLDINNLFQ